MDLHWLCVPVPVPLFTACSHHPAVTVVCHARSAWLRGEVITEQGGEQSEAGAMQALSSSLAYPALRVLLIRESLQLHVLIMGTSSQ